MKKWIILLFACLLAGTTVTATTSPKRPRLTIETLGVRVYGDKREDYAVEYANDLGGPWMTIGRVKGDGIALVLNPNLNRTGFFRARWDPKP